MKDLTKRTITGAIYVLSVIAAVCIDRYVAAVYFGMIMILALREFISVSAKAEVSLNAPMIYFVSVFSYLALVSHAFGFAYSAIAMFASLLCIIALAISALYVKSATPFTSMAYSLTAVGYIVLPLSLSNLLFAMHDYFDCNVLLSIFIFAWCNDTFAYLVGCKFGKRRLFERHSPKKSWGGFVCRYGSGRCRYVAVAWRKRIYMVADGCGNNRCRNIRRPYRVDVQETDGGEGQW